MLNAELSRSMPHTVVAKKQPTGSSDEYPHTNYFSITVRKNSV